MAKYTENIRLAQPEGSDYYDIEVFNHNSELIDKKIGEMDNSLSTIQEGATREKAGIVQFGTEEGKALEGMMLARLAGCIGYGGDIQTAGVKDINYIYYDRNTRKMYKCLNQNSDVSANVANFIPLDNNSLLDRLENLITLDKGDYFNANLGGLIIKVIGFSSKTGKNRYNFDKPFPNRCLICILVENDGLRDTEPALEAYDKNGFSSNNAIGTGAFYCLAIGY